jgi:large subunit ribosomal protein L4e
MFAPTKVFRKWHARVPKKVRKLAVRAALAASAIPALVMARGHNLEDVPEIPLVVPNSVEALEKTKDAVKLLKDIGAYHDVEKVQGTMKIRVGKGKRRNRRYSIRKGPLLVVSKRCEALKSFRNLPGVDINYVSALNLLRLAPGGHIGRLIIWTEDAFNQLDTVLKVDSIVGLPDSKRVINSEEVQGVIRPKIKNTRRKRKNMRRPRLNPAFKVETKIQKKLYLERCKVNADPKLRNAKRKAKKEQEKLWLKKVSGKVDKKGQPRTPHKTPKSAKKKGKGKK